MLRGKLVIILKKAFVGELRMSTNTIDAFAQHNKNLCTPQTRILWEELISMIRKHGAELRESYNNSEEVENVLSFATQHGIPNSLSELSKLLLFFVEKHFGQLKLNKIFLRIIKKYVSVVKASKDTQVIGIANIIIKTISNEKTHSQKTNEASAEQNMQMWNHKGSLFKIIAQKLPKNSSFLVYFENVFNEIKNSYTIYDEENFESFFVRKFLIHTFNAHDFAQMDMFIELAKININMPFDLHEQGDQQVTLAHHLAQFLDCNDCYYLARKLINKINFKIVDKAGNTFMHHAVMSQWDHDLRPFIKKSDITIKNKLGFTCKDLDKNLVKKHEKSIFA